MRVIAMLLQSFRKQVLFIRNEIEVILDALSRSHLSYSRTWKPPDALFVL